MTVDTDKAPGSTPEKWVGLGTVKLKPSPEGEPTRGWSEEILTLGRDKALEDGFAETENNPRWLGFT